MAAATITIDPTQRLGKLRALHGVNNGPYSMDGLMDLTVPFQTAKFPSVRLHDVHYPCDVVDINVVFPDMSLIRTTRTPTILSAPITISRRLSRWVVLLPIGWGYAIDHHPCKKYVYPPTDPARWSAGLPGHRPALQRWLGQRLPQYGGPVGNS